MKIPSSFPRGLLLLILLAVVNGSRAAEPAGTGTIAGTIRYTGKVPEPRRIEADGLFILHSDLVVDPKTKGLRFVVAVLENAPAQAPLKKADPVEMDQHRKLFTPHVVAVQHGQAVRFLNSDESNHSVLAVSTVRANQFNQFTPPGQALNHVFEPQKPPVMIGCSLHAWMRAFVYVVPHPWFAISDAQGSFRIANVPAGKYTLWLRHPDTFHQERREIEVAAGKTLPVSIEWEKVGK